MKSTVAIDQQFKNSFLFAGIALVKPVTDARVGERALYTEVQGNKCQTTDLDTTELFTFPSLYL